MKAGFLRVPAATNGVERGLTCAAFVRFRTGFSARVRKGTIMHRSTCLLGAAFGCLAWLLVGAALGQDWPQWRGPNRDGKVTGFKAPAAWPKELKEKWNTEVGNGVSTPALVGDRLYVVTREGSEEVIRCLDAADGKEVWQDKYAAEPATGAAGSFPGPRSSPAVAEGKVCTLGVRGVVSCLEAASGKLLWRKDDYDGAAPQFFAVQLAADSGRRLLRASRQRRRPGRRRWRRRHRL